MIKKMLGVFTSVVAALAVVGVAWAGTDDGTSTSVTAAGETSTSVSIDDSSSSTDATFATSTDATVGSSTDATVASSTGATVDSSTSTSVDDSSSTSIAASTSTSADSNSTTSTTVDSTTSTSTDDNDRSVVPGGVTVHTIPGVGSVTTEVALGQLFLVDVTAPGWSVEFDKIESDRIELEFTSAADAEAEFETRINDGRLEVRVEVD